MIGDGFVDWGYLVAVFLAPSIAFIVTYAIGGVLIVWRTWRYGVPIAAFVCAAGWNVGAYTQSPVAVLATIAVMLLGLFVLVWHRMGQLLRRFPERTAAEVPAPSNSKHAVGHYAILSPTNQSALSWGEGGEPYRSFPGACLLAGTAFLCATATNLLENDLVLAPLFALFAGMTHVFFYCQSRTSHLGLFARWARRRFFVPEFDRVLALPLAVLAITVLLTWTRLGQYSHPLAFPSMVGLTVFVLIRYGPDYRTWSLTAPCRHVLIKSQGITR